MSNKFENCDCFKTNINAIYVKCFDTDLEARIPHEWIDQDSEVDNTFCFGDLVILDEFFGRVQWVPDAELHFLNNSDPKAKATR